MCVIVCIKMENIVFSPPKIGWFIYSQCCSRDGRLMESVQFSIGIGGSGQILYYLVGSLNLTNILTHTHRPHRQRQNDTPIQTTLFHSHSTESGTGSSNRRMFTTNIQLHHLIKQKFIKRHFKISTFYYFSASAQIYRSIFHFYGVPFSKRRTKIQCMIDNEVNIFTIFPTYDNYKKCVIFFSSLMLKYYWLLRQIKLIFRSKINCNKCTYLMLDGIINVVFG